jgi:hypothetical protein
LLSVLCLLGNVFRLVSSAFVCGLFLHGGSPGAWGVCPSALGAGWGVVLIFEVS